MKKVFLLIAITLVLCACSVAQNAAPDQGPTVLYSQQLPAPGATPAPAPPNVFFHTEKIGDNKMGGAFFAVSDAGTTVTGAPYSATAATDTTQMLADGNKIVNKTETVLARDSQGRTRREETMGNIGPLAVKAPKMAFINDPVLKVNYILNLSDQTAHVMRLPVALPGGPVSASGMAMSTNGAGMATPASPNISTATIQRRVMVAGANPGMEQRVWVDSASDPSQVKTESLGTQVIEGVSAEGKRVTRTIPAGQIGNERPLEITSEVWTSPELQIVVLSKRNDPRFGETVYRLTNIQRGEPDHSLFEVPSNFTVKEPGN